jgi:hypothetical protein
MRNFRMRRDCYAGARKGALMLYCLLPVPVLVAQEAPPPFACEVRYHFREQLRATQPSHKSFSAPSHEREALPVSQVTTSDDSITRFVRGRVAHLPYRFLVRIIRTTKGQGEMLEVNVVSTSGKPLAGFPQIMPNPLNRTENSSRREFELPVNEILRKKIEKTLLQKNQFLTSVDLIVGMDDDFLSARFPKSR